MLSKSYSLENQNLVELNFIHQISLNFECERFLREEQVLELYIL